MVCVTSHPLRENKGMETAEQRLKLDARWTDDCQGKKDYDGEILSISTRYWPRGGGFQTFDSRKPELGLQGNDARPDVKPSANSSLMVRYKDPDGGDLGDDLTLAEMYFEADTEQEVKAQVEAWAQVQMDRAVAVLRKEFGK